MPASDITPAVLRRNTAYHEPSRRQIGTGQGAQRRSGNYSEWEEIRTGGKKSGSLIVAGESVIECIDWPHLYVTWMVNGRRKGVPYTDLRVMIESPLCKWDYRVMTRVFRIIMQDAMNISWPFVLALYKTIGVDVGKGVMEWDDIERINEYRSNYSHTAVRGGGGGKEGHL